MTNLEYIRVLPPTVVRRLKPGIRRGPYDLVALEEPLGDEPNALIWFDPETENVVREEMVDRSRPFNQIVFDFDGSLVDTEGPYGYFAVCWRSLFREAGIVGSDGDLERLRKRVYIWEGTLPLSVKGMIERIRQGLDKQGNEINPDEHTALAKLLEPKLLVRWVQMNGNNYGPDIFSQVADIIGDRKERIGAELLAYNPLLVLQLAPFTPGAVDFMKAIPPDVLAGIASGSRVKTTILPVLQAHAAVGERFVLDRVGSLIVGEDNLMGSSFKPDRRFYENAVITMAHILHREGRIPGGGVHVRDILYVGDRIATSSVLDAPLTRKGISHLVINEENQSDLGPFVATVPSFRNLLKTIHLPNDHTQNPILARVASTINCASLTQ